jgi:hypothetical protein
MCDYLTFARGLDPDARDTCGSIDLTALHREAESDQSFLQPRSSANDQPLETLTSRPSAAETLASNTFNSIFTRRKAHHATG